MAEVYKGLTPRILLTARDPATGRAMKMLSSALVGHTSAEVVVASQAPSTEILCELTGVTHKHISVPVFSSDKDLMTYVEHLLREVAPDIVVTGVSGPDYGIDEAVLALSPRNQFSPYAIQSYWGDVNDSFEKHAQTYLVLDDYAADLTVRRTGRKTEIIGSINHIGYGGLDTVGLRREFRLQCNSRADLLIGYFGQPFEKGLGYYQTMERFFSSVTDYTPEAHIIWRPHPKESKYQNEIILKLLQEYSISYQLGDRYSLESMLCGVDLVVSAFSTCGYDLQQLLRVSNEPLALPVYLMYESRLKKWFVEYTGLESLPMSQNGMAVVVESQKDLRGLLNAKEIRRKKNECWQQIKSIFPDNSNNILRVVELLMKNYQKESYQC